jgi:hypothetical protein
MQCILTSFVYENTLRFLVSCLSVSISYSLSLARNNNSNCHGFYMIQAIKDGQNFTSNIVIRQIGHVSILTYE